MVPVSMMKKQKKDIFIMVKKTVEYGSLILHPGPNVTDIPRKNCLRLFVEEMLSPFYVFQVKHPTCLSTLTYNNF